MSSVWLGELKLGGLFGVERTNEAAGSVRRGIVELTTLNAAEIAGVADTIADVDGG